MIVPTAPVSGIEDWDKSPPPVRHFFEYGWEWLSKNIKKKNPADLGMAINSETVRSANQFHIHLACSQPAVVTDLKKINPSPKTWTVNAIISGKKYDVTLVDNLASVFQVVNDHVPKGDKIDDHSIAVIPKDNSEYFVLDTKGSSEAALKEDIGCKSE